MTLEVQAFGPGGGMTEAVVLNGAQPARQDVPEVPRHELHCGECADLPPITGRAVLPPEADGVIVDSNHAAIAQGGARDAGAQILEGGSSVSGGLNVHAPVLGPHRGIHLPVMNLEERAQMLPESRLQERPVDQIVRFPHAYEASALFESGARYQAMDMGMKSQLLIPCVEHRRETTHTGLEPLRGRQLLGQSARDGCEEQIVGFLGERPEEARSQLSGEREGDQEVGRLDPLLQLALDPLGGRCPPALRTGLVIAGVPGEVELTAIRTSKGSPAQRRSPAVGDGPNGAALIRRERG